MDIDQFINQARSWLSQRASYNRVRFSPPRRTRINTTALFGGIPLRRGAPLLLRHRLPSLSVEKGWQQRHDGHWGFYRAAGRRWQGWIREPYPGGYEAYIWHPPLRELDRNTEHRRCFMEPQPDGRYTIHFWEMPASLDHAVNVIEMVLKEAFRSPS